MMKEIVSVLLLCMVMADTTDSFWIRFGNPCGGSEIWRFPYAFHQCCGTQPYEPEEKVCCRGVLQYRRGGAFCCGIQACIPSYQVCCGGYVRPGPRCCGNQSYNPSTQICCRGVVRPKTQGTACCGTQNYNPSTQQCCRGTVRPRGFSCFPTPSPRTPSRGGGGGGPDRNVNHH